MKKKDENINERDKKIKILEDLINKSQEEFNDSKKLINQLKSESEEKSFEYI